MRTADTPENRIGWLVKRTDYLALQAGKRWVTPFFVVQMRPFAPESAAEGFAWRVGFTTSRKVGNAVTRNLARRRLREVVRLHLPLMMQPGYDLVLIGRTAAASVPFEKLVDALAHAARGLKVAK